MGRINEGLKMEFDLDTLLQEAIKATRLAGEGIMAIYATDFAVEIKEDDSPVTQADKQADALIREYLGKRFPEIGFLTEESIDTKDRLRQKAIWIVDPVDGTQDFVNRTGDFTTNVALCVDHQIVIGVINCPALRKTYYAVKGGGAFVMDEEGNSARIHVSNRKEGLRYMCSVSHYNEKEKAFYAAHADRFLGEPKAVGAALKFCLLAEGKFDYFIRISGGTKEWDVAAGDILVHEAGGIMCEPSKKKFAYNREDVYNRNGYVMANSQDNLMLD